MVDQHPRAVCFVVMPTTQPERHIAGRPAIDADAVFSHLEHAVIAEDLDCVRADIDANEPFPTELTERLLIAQYLIVDVTDPHPRIAYVVGVRHGVGGRPTIAVGAADHVDGTSAGTPLSPTITYRLTKDGTIAATTAEEFVADVRRRLRGATSDSADVEIPVLSVAGRQSNRLEHDKTDVFLARLRNEGGVGMRIGAALDMDDRRASLAELAAIEHELVDVDDPFDGRGSALLGIYLAYRERHAYQQMLDLYPKLSPEVRAAPVVREQLALALNRLAEHLDEIAEAAREAGDQPGCARARDDARALRNDAIATLDGVADHLLTVETWAVRGRVHKSWFSAERAAGNHDEAARHLAEAIDAYERGLAVDMRDYFPGVNAVTLRLIRAEPGDLAALEQLVPVVRMAVDNAPPAQTEEESYWQAATKLELASADRDWDAADRHLATIQGSRAADWMHATTAKNLRLQQHAHHADSEAGDRIESLIEGLRPSTRADAPAGPERTV